MSRKNDQLVFRDNTSLRLFGGLFMLTTALLFLFDQKTTPWILFDAAFFVVGLLAVLLSSDLLITADGASRTLWLRYNFLLFHVSRNIAFDDIADIQAQLARGTFSRDFSRRVYRLVAVLKDGRVMGFRPYFTGDQKKTQVATRLREFITGQKESSVPRVPPPVSTLSL